MRPMHLILLAGLLLLAEAALRSVPDIIAAREGGMGLGSALIVGQATHVGGIVLGALLGAHLVDRRSIRGALVVGSLLYYGGVIGVGHQPSHHLGWVVVILGLAGLGIGLMLTAAFTAASTVAGRAWALAALLFAPIASSLVLATPIYRPGPPALVVTAAIVVAGVVAIAYADRTDAPPERRAASRLDRGSAITVGSLLAAGVIAALWGIEPSGVSATMVARSLGLAGLGPLDGLRIALLIGGLLLVAAGIALLVTRARPSASTALAAVASGAAAFAAAALLAIGGFAMPRELSPPDSGGGPLGEMAAVVTGAAGLALGAFLLARGTAPRVVAIAGALLLGALAAAVVIGVDLGGGVPGAVGAVALIALVAFAAGITAVALRFILASAPAEERALAAAAGVAAAAFGAMAGLMVGAADGMSRAIGVASGVSLGAVVVAASALVTVATVAALARGEPSATAGRRGRVASPADPDRPAA